MKPTHFWRALTWCLLVFVFGLVIYRAKTQTIAHDEALEYEWFLAGGVEHVLSYDPTNHILFTLIAKPLVWSLGNRELILRSPSLLGTVIYILATYLLCRRLFGEGVPFFLSVAMLTLNPQILDFMPAARGYILGLAFLMVAMYAMARAAERGVFQAENSAWRWESAIASTSLALAVAATYPNVVPAFSLALCFSAVALGGFRALFQWREQKTRAFAKYFLLPGAATGFCILWPYLIQTRPAHFYAGLTNARDAIRDNFAASFLHKWTDDVFNSLGAVPSAPGSWQVRVTDFGEYLFFPALFILVAVGLFYTWNSQPSSPNRQDVNSRIIAGAAVISVALVVALHMAAKVHYPNSRFGLFLIPLFTLGGLLAARKVYSQFPRWPLRAAGYFLAAAVILDYALCVQTATLRYNAYDVISRDLYQAIANDARSRNLTNVRVGGTWWYEPEINYYRRRYHTSWMLEYDIKDRSYFWQTPNSLTPADYDYFVFLPASDPGLAGPHVRTIYRDETRHVTIVAISH